MSDRLSRQGHFFFAILTAALLGVATAASAGIRKRVLILDSLYDAIVEADVGDHYEPIYSINEQGW